MNKTIVWLVIVVSLLVSGCSVTSGNTKEVTGTGSDTTCPTGVEVFPIDIYSSKDGVIKTFDAYTVRPNEGCHLPILYCVTKSQATGGGSGESCVVIER